MPGPILVPGALRQLPPTGFPGRPGRGPFAPDLAALDWPSAMPPRTPIPLPGFPHVQVPVREWVPGLSLPDGTLITSHLDRLGPDPAVELMRLFAVFGVSSVVTALPAATVTFGAMTLHR